MGRLLAVIKEKRPRREHGVLLVRYQPGIGSLLASQQKGLTQRAAHPEMQSWQFPPRSPYSPRLCARTIDCRYLVRRFAMGPLQFRSSKAENSGTNAGMCRCSGTSSHLYPTAADPFSKDLCPVLLTS
jgi:hypothetical protein